MALLVEKCAPVLTGKSARRFMRRMAEVDKLPTRELPKEYFEEYEKFVEKSRKFAEKLKQKSKKEGKNEGTGVQFEERMH